MIIGKLAYDPGTDRFSGEVATPLLGRLLIEARPVENWTDSARNAPSYTVFSICDGGVLYQFGSFWRRTGPHGTESLTMRLDDPMLSVPIETSIMRISDGSPLGTYQIVWDRYQKK